MFMTKQLKRSDVPEELTWDLTKIFESDEQHQAALESVSAKMSELVTLRGTLGESADKLYQSIKQMEEVMREIGTAYIYAHLKSDQDTANGTYQTMMAKTINLYVQLEATLAFVTPEILSIPQDTLDNYINSHEQLKDYKHYFERLTSKRAYVLSDKEEELLAGAADVMSASEKTASQLMNADLKHGEVTNLDGERQRLTNGLYSQLVESTNRQARQEAYEVMYTSFGTVKNTLASTLSSTIKSHNYTAKVRGYNSARHQALSENFVPEEVYDTLVNVVNEKLPLFHRYLALRKKVLKLDELRMFDMYTPIVGEAPISFTKESAQEITLKALAPLGDEYVALLKRAFDERWIDWEENEGKRTGAYSSGNYDTAPYVLMNWRDSVNQLYTLVHELGHSLHSYFTHQAQPYQYGSYPIFLAEIASTTNENLLTEYLLQTEKDPTVRAYIINHYLDGVKGTVFRQTQFAEFEHFMYEQDAKGQPLTQDFLSESYGKLNEKYYGIPADEYISLEWARIPHFYYNYYVFQYSTGFSAASALAKRILTEGQSAVNRYFGFLKAGISDYPINVMKEAGVDMTQATYLEEALSVFEERLNELETLLA
ncbi:MULTISPECIES: oligoendopeptidase F [unclassified Granulicatella]|uniref:oligoendopeptidase F n=1 Tax=unclassified Granulicatella TaxID=2630493 RepID=UPI001073EF01|nr:MULTISPECIES: oligoendopeptidase F [unclassified Granulicatella]MBF0779832.1 oligoendopeptidase F [Granulicatella sp. 19428wC4_WM01]TFU96132.1 oligoendopeptidase F [Granulicatella sp. WM01]